jgi:hypothetical protein
MPDIIRPEDLADLTSMAETGPGIADEGQAPHDDPHFEADLARAERRLRWSREHPMFGVHPDGVGPTLGQDLGRPNPGHDAERPESPFDPPS